MSTHAGSLEDSRDPLTLTRFLLAENQQFRGSTGSFTMLLQSVQLACKAIANATRKAGLANLYGIAGGSENSSGDQQKKLDVFSNDVFINCIRYSKQVYAMVSEENEELIVCDEEAGGYAIVFDPLDGSSNIDCNVSVGTIFGIYKKDESVDHHQTSVKDVLKPGNQLIAAGYALYGAATMLVLTTGLGVNGFTLDAQLGEFILTHPKMRVPKSGKIYSINEGNATSWDEPTRAFVDYCKFGRLKPNGTSQCSARYIGSMVADVHRTLLYGGVFCYPADKKNKNGKLRLLYECNPMAFIVEQAGGKASDGVHRILDIQPTTLHGRHPIFCGSYDDVTLVEHLYKTNGKLPPKM